MKAERNACECFSRRNEKRTADDVVKCADSVRKQFSGGKGHKLLHNLVRSMYMGIDGASEGGRLFQLGLGSVYQNPAVAFTVPPKVALPSAFILTNAVPLLFASKTALLPVASKFKRTPVAPEVDT